MKLEVRIAERPHFWAIKTLDLNFLGDTYRRNEIAYFEPDISHCKTKNSYGASVDHLHKELRRIAIEQSTDAVRAVQFHHSVTDYSVPAGAVLPRRKDTHREH